MRRIYEAFGKDKREIIELDNDINSFNKFTFSKSDIGISDFVLIGSIGKNELSTKLNIRWCLNGLLPRKFNTEDIIIIEPLIEHFDDNLKNIHETNTTFKEEIELSKKAVVLMSTKLYDELIKDKKYKEIMSKMNVQLYEGEKDLALRMLLLNKRYIYLDLNDDGYVFDELNHPDLINYNLHMLDKQLEIIKMIQNGKIAKIKKKERMEIKRREIQQDDNCKMITGLTKDVEGEIELDDNTKAVTDIGKIRENQEDAILLIKDKNNPEFKMMVVADGVGGSRYGEVASHIIISQLKEWFENLSDEEKGCYYTGLEGLKEKLIDEIEIKIQPKVEYDTLYAGESTVVCAIVGKKDTMVLNVGDSRAYIVSKGKLVQVSREDTVARENYLMGKTPNKEVARFDREAHRILQCIGMDRRDLIRPSLKIIENKDYDMILLFTDGVTDCLSDEDIAVACRTTDKKELANKIVEKAIRHDSILPEENDEYDDLVKYIPGGKDNTTAAIYVKKDDGEERE